MSTNILGIRNNNTIVSYTAATKRTKEVSLTFSNTPTGWSVDSAKGYAGSDSLGNWWFDFCIMATMSSATSGQVDVDGVTFANITNGFQPIPLLLQSGSLAGRAFASANTSTIFVEHESASTSFRLKHRVKLESKPTWADANMEGVTAVDVMIPFGQTGMPGEYKIGTGTHSDTSFSGTNVVSDVDSVALIPGMWIINARCTFVANGSTSTAFRGGIGSTSGNNLTGIAAGDSHRWDFEDTLNGKVFSTSAMRVVTITTNTTYYCKAVATYSAGTPQYTGEIFAVRLAPG